MLVQGALVPPQGRWHPAVGLPGLGLPHLLLQQAEAEVEADERVTLGVVVPEAARQQLHRLPEPRPDFGQAEQRHHRPPLLDQLGLDRPPERLQPPFVPEAVAGHLELAAALLIGPQERDPVVAVLLLTVLVRAAAAAPALVESYS